VGAARYNSNLNPPNNGYWSAYSDDGGNTWNGPYLITDAFDGSGNPKGGGLSRIVWSPISGFNAFWPDCTNAPTCVLKHYQSSDGRNWTRQNPDIGTYTAPSLSSSVSIGGPDARGEFSYAATIDAVASSGLGWVVAFPATLGSLNGINIATERGNAGATVTYIADLFSADIATSGAGDWYLSYQTYQNGTQGTLPIEQGVNYRAPSGSYASGVIANGIDPSQWMYLDGSADRCNPGSLFCYASGDYFRPAMNQFTGASIPMVVQSASNLNDLDQSFIQDPPAGNATPIALEMQPYVTGSNIASLGVVTPALLARINAGQYRYALSTAVYFGLAQAGLVPK